MALYDDEHEAEEYIRELISDLHETNSETSAGFESTIYSKLSEGSQMTEFVKVLVFDAHTPTDDETIELVTNETFGVTEVLGAVQDESTKRIVTIDLEEESDASLEDESDPLDRPDVDPDQIPD